MSTLLHTNSILNTTINNDSCYLLKLIFNFVSSVNFNNRKIYQFNKLIHTWVYSFMLYEWMLNKQREAECSARPL